MAGRLALFDVLEAVVDALRSATETGQPLDGVTVYDGPAPAYDAKYLVVATVTEAERDDQFSLAAGAYAVTYEIGLGFGIIDPNPDITITDPWRLLRRQIGGIVQGAAAILENDPTLASLTQGIDVIPTAYTPTERGDGLQVIAAADVVADVVVEP